MYIEEILAGNNPNNIFKAADVYPIDNPDKKHIRLRLEYTEAVLITKGKTQLVYLAAAAEKYASTHSIIKAGYATTGKGGIQACLKWYGAGFTLSMKEGRVVPHYYMRDILDAGGRIEIYVEAIKMEPYERLAIDGSKMIPGMRPVMDPKDREKDWCELIGKTPLNRQEKGSKANDPIAITAMNDYAKRGGNVASKWIL